MPLLTHCSYLVAAGTLSPTDSLPTAGILYTSKNKMAAATILNCYFVTVDHPRSLLHGPNIVLKFHVNRITTALDMAI